MPLPTMQIEAAASPFAFAFEQSVDINSGRRKKSENIKLLLLSLIVGADDAIAKNMFFFLLQIVQ